MGASKTSRRSQRKAPPISITMPSARDERVPARLRRLPQRIAQANAAGPGYNQTELAEKSGLSQSVISKLASSSNLFGLRLGTIYRLAGALGVSVSWLLGETDAPMRKRVARKRRVSV